MKLGLLGTTMLYASGDSGVGGDCTTFQIDFPASCPYITAVGATAIPSGGTYKSKEVAATGIQSGGGFSNFWPIPSYQKSAIASYFANHAPPYSSSQYVSRPS
jgi:tripeptidyl-peptidase I